MKLIKQNFTLLTIITILTIFYAFHFLSNNTRSIPQPTIVVPKTNSDLKITNSLQERIKNNPSQIFSITIQFTNPINTDQKHQLENYLQNPQYSLEPINIGVGLATGNNIQNHISELEYVKQVKEADINQPL